MNHKAKTRINLKFVLKEKAQSFETIYLDKIECKFYIYQKSN